MSESSEAREQALRGADREREAPSWAPAAAAFGFPRVHWRVALTCAAVLTVLFAALAVPIGPVSLSRFWTILRVQALAWGLWLPLLPCVVMAARRAHGAGLASARGLAVHLLAGSALALMHATAFAVLRWSLGMTDSESASGVVAATVAFVIGGDFLRYVRGRMLRLTRQRGRSRLRSGPGT